MQRINNYIFEKLKINKDSKLSDEDKYLNIIDILLKYLKDNYYFGFSDKDFEIKSKHENQICLIVPKELVRSNISTIGTDIAIKIKRECKLDWFWMYDGDNFKITWGDEI